MENQEEKKLNNTFPKVVDVYITMENGDELRVFKKADDVQMQEQEEKQMSIEYLVKKINKLEQDLIELEKQHEQSLKVAFKKGYEKGYTDHANLINMLNK